MSEPIMVTMPRGRVWRYIGNIRLAGGSPVTN
jgi:hypothetical protein